MRRLSAKNIATIIAAAIVVLVAEHLVAPGVLPKSREKR